MTVEKKVQLQSREQYTVRDLLADLKSIDPTPSVLNRVASEVIYFQWSCCKTDLGDGSPVTSGLSQLLAFMQGGYEQLLVKGELWRANDTPRAALNQVEKALPPELMDYVLSRPGVYIHSVLDSAFAERQQEVMTYERLEKGIRSEIEKSPEDPDLYNKLRLLLWILGRHRESSEAFKTAKKLGWKPEASRLVTI
ncbi:MAG: hypothetical protein C4K49_11150 [Candidatus Thorarchaeota archaeon]|nr:MAG: hypothetical protein C4K49_11150 [Candidatus Thorarchaeota archaeon]